MTLASQTDMTATDTVIAYHDRTKHRLERYAAGPETLDWSAQPDPFREFEGCQRIALPLSADALKTGFAQLHAGTHAGIEAQPLSLDALGALFELSFALSAWKEYGPDRWALRCNPSSGNLHPSEVYLVCRGVAGLDDGVYHYLSREHALERRAALNAAAGAEAGIWLGLSSIHWREAWKYGERAFRYCQLDAGHALGAARYAAAALGWRAEFVVDMDAQTLAGLLGLDRDADFGRAEREDAEFLLALMPEATSATPLPPRAADCHSWHGRANVLDRHPMYRWPVIAEVAAASASAPARDAAVAPALPTLTHAGEALAANVIRQRRSAQRFDGAHVMPADEFMHMLDALLPRAAAPWDVWDYAPRLHPVLFVHRVEGIEPGLYALPRRADATDALRAAMRADFAWRRAESAPAHLPLYLLAAVDCAGFARTLHCHQAIASASCFALGMLAEFEAPLAGTPWRYRQLHWEAGLIGQALYLEAEALGLRGTGIGCFFDDEFHQALGLGDRRFQTLYHFTVGRPLTDDRILSLPPYADRK